MTAAAQDENEPSHPHHEAERSDDRRDDRGRSARSRTVSRSIQDNPLAALVGAIAASAITTLAAAQAVQKSQTPTASSSQIEVLSAKFDSLAGKVDLIGGDLRSFKDSDLIMRTRKVEDFVTTQNEANRQQLETRREWIDWRARTEAKLEALLRSSGAQSPK